MPELRLTVGLPGSPDDEPAALDELMSALAREAGHLAEFARAPGIGKPDGPSRIFNAKFSGPEALTAVLRGTGGWYMRHPRATVTFRMESSKGGTTIQLREFTPVGFAKIAREVEGYLE